MEKVYIVQYKYHWKHLKPIVAVLPSEEMAISYIKNFNTNANSPVFYREYEVLKEF